MLLTPFSGTMNRIAFAFHARLRRAPTLPVGDTIPVARASGNHHESRAWCAREMMPPARRADGDCLAVLEPYLMRLGVRKFWWRLPHSLARSHDVLVTQPRPMDGIIARLVETGTLLYISRPVLRTDRVVVHDGWTFRG